MTPPKNTWTNASQDGRWDNPANWSLGRLPRAGDDICYPAPAQSERFLDTVGRVALSVAYAAGAVFFAYIGAINAREWVTSLADRPLTEAHFKGAFAFCFLAGSAVLVGKAFRGCK